MTQIVHTPHAYRFSQILLSLVFAYGIFVALLGFPFFPFLCFTGVYICMGIGADDVFVFLAGERPCHRMNRFHLSRLDSRAHSKVTLRSTARHLMRCGPRRVRSV